MEWLPALKLMAEKLSAFWFNELQIKCTSSSHIPSENLISSPQCSVKFPQVFDSTMYVVKRAQRDMGHVNGWMLDFESGQLTALSH